MEPKGGGRALNFNYNPQARMGNTYIDSGNMKLEEIVEMTKVGVYLKESNSGYVVPAKGQFYFNCGHGYFIENGEITDMIGNVGMSGMTLEVLNNIYAIGDKWEPEFKGSCGKMGQWIPISGGGPNLGVSDLVVGGNV